MSFFEFHSSYSVVTPFGEAEARGILIESDNIWFWCVQSKTGEFWWWLNEYVRAKPNISDGRFKMTEIKLPADFETALAKHRERYK